MVYPSGAYSRCGNRPISQGNWRPRSSKTLSLVIILDCTSRSDYEGAKEKCLVRAVHYEPNELKIAMDQMIYEERDAIQVCYHSWVTKPIVENDVVKGIIFESKEGRKAILAKVVIDATGDGDIYSKSGAPYASLADGTCRSSTTALVYRIGGVDWDAYHEWQKVHPVEAAAFATGLSKTAGFRVVPFQSSRDGVCWIDNWHSNRDCTVIKDQTATEINTRMTIHALIDYMRECVPFAFKNAFLYDIAPQLGCRCSRRLKGEYVMTANDFAFAKKHDDVIAWHSTIARLTTVVLLRFLTEPFCLSRSKTCWHPDAICPQTMWLSTG